jgi:hypothetical protein
MVFCNVKGRLDVYFCIFIFMVLMINFLKL